MIMKWRVQFQVSDQRPPLQRPGSGSSSGSIQTAGLSEVGNLGQLASVFKELAELKALGESGSVFKEMAVLKALGESGSVFKEMAVLKALGESGTVDYPYKPGDRVKVTANMETLKRMQQGHGGWNDSMKNVHTHVFDLKYPPCFGHRV